MRLFLVKLRNPFAKRSGEYSPVFASKPREAAEFYCDRLITVGTMPKSNCLRVYVCEHVNDGTPGFKIAANTDGDIRYDVTSDGKTKTVELSEHSYAGEDDE